MNWRNSTPLTASHNRAVTSSLPVSTVRPSGENATDDTDPVCPVNWRSSRPLAASHSRAVLSALPVSTFRPSGEIATEVTTLECPNCVTISILACSVGNVCAPARVDASSPNNVAPSSAILIDRHTFIPHSDPCLAICSAIGSTGLYRHTIVGWTQFGTNVCNSYCQQPIKSTDGANSIRCSNENSGTSAFF